MLLRLALILVVISAVLSTACASAAPPATPLSTPSGAGQTYGQLVSDGKSVYAARCAGCHGQDGEGKTAPAIIGANAQLSKYQTALPLRDKVKYTMPKNAPGTLSQQEYLVVVSYLLVQNKYVSPDTVYDEALLGNIALK